jgi:uncharacterized repeat protein (TIGR03803 family)
VCAAKALAAFCGLLVLVVNGCRGGGGHGGGGPLEILYSFGSSSTDATGPDGMLTQGTDGNFYGATSRGGASGKGVVFKITPTGEETLLHSFTGSPSDGASPETTRLIQGTDGNFYGVTPAGGANDRGTIFMLTPEGIETVLYSFAGGTGDGALPFCGLVQGSDGNFYGTTLQGGLNDTGTVFKFTLAGVETILFSFAPFGSVAATSLYAALLQGSDGNLYGMSMNGGLTNNGTVFRVTTDGALTVLHSFGGSDDGFSPNLRLIFGNDGNLYGTTGDGGANAAPVGLGTVFKLTPDGVETVLHSFAEKPLDGNHPEGGLVQGSDGNFYGTTAFGGANDLGTVFKLTPAGIETVLYSFTGGPSDGSRPIDNMVEGSDGYLYGMTSEGGASNQGTFFRIAVK